MKKNIWFVFGLLVFLAALRVLSAVNGAISGRLVDASEVLNLGTASYSNATAFAVAPAVATLADSDATLTVGTSAVYQILSATLTGNRTITLSTTGAINGSRFVIIRKGLGLFTLSVGSLKVVPSATAGSVSAVYDGSAWQLENYSLL